MLEAWNVATASQPSMFSAEDFPASPTPLLANVADLRTSVTSGPSTPDSFASLDRDGLWRKTCQGYSQMTLDGSLEAFSETWPRAGMTRNGTAYLQVPLAPLTKGIASGLLPTPAAVSYGSSQNGINGIGGTHERPSANTPSLETMARRNLWPTPTQGDAKSSGSRNTAQSQAHFGISLTDAVRGDQERGRQWPTPQANDWKTGQDYSQAGSGTFATVAACAHWAVEPDVGRVAHGVPQRVDRLRDSATPSSRKSRSGSRSASKKQKG